MNDSDKNNSNAVVTDYELERGEHPIGKKVHISTVTHAWRGTLLAVTASYYVLDPEHKVALVDSTGRVADYMKDMRAVSDGDEFDPKSATKRPVIRVLRGAVSWMLSES